MPGPVVTQCGGAGQPACKPENATETHEPILLSRRDIALAWITMSHEDQKAGLAELHAEGHEHAGRWHGFMDSLGNALGEAKFGG